MRCFQLSERRDQRGGAQGHDLEAVHMRSAGKDVLHTLQHHRGKVLEPEARVGILLLGQRKLSVGRAVDSGGGQQVHPANLHLTECGSHRQRPVNAVCKSIGVRSVGIWQKTRFDKIVDSVDLAEFLDGERVVLIEGRDTLADGDHFQVQLFFFIQKQQTVDDRAVQFTAARDRYGFLL